MVDRVPDDVISVDAIVLDLCRRAAGLSQRQLAELAGVTPGYVSRILSGEQGRVSMKVMDGLLEAFGNRVKFSELRGP